MTKMKIWGLRKNVGGQKRNCFKKSACKIVLGHNKTDSAHQELSRPEHASSRLLKLANVCTCHCKSAIAMEMETNLNIP
jgi:hypothetical protein